MNLNEWMNQYYIHIQTHFLQMTCIAMLFEYINDYFWLALTFINKHENILIEINYLTDVVMKQCLLILLIKVKTQNTNKRQEYSEMKVSF